MNSQAPVESFENRLASLGIVLPEVAAPVAAYTPALRVGQQVLTSGQLPFIDGKLPATGQVGEKETAVSPDEAKQLARTATLNALSAVVSVTGGLDTIDRIVKVVGFVSSSPDFYGQPSVVNGASELLQEIFGENGVHVRSAVGVASLPLNSPVEIELIVSVK